VTFYSEIMVVIKIHFMIQTRSIQVMQHSNLMIVIRQNIEEGNIFIDCASYDG